MKKILHKLLFNIFWKTEDKIIDKKLQVLISPRLGKLGCITWYALTSNLEFIAENESEDADEERKR